MKAVSLFSGIGGFDLGLERAGIETILQVEIDPFCRRVLEKHWPDVLRIADVRDVTAADCAGVDLIYGGFPCQPVSVEGKRLGQVDERWLWPEFARLIRQVRPRYALMENVAGLFTAGLDLVLADLAAIGRDAEWTVVSACSVGAAHPRERVFILSYSAGIGLEGRVQEWSRIGIEALPQTPVRWELSAPYVCRSSDGIPDRTHRLRSLGNAVVPQVAEYVGRRLMAFDRALTDETTTSTPEGAIG